MEAVAPQPPAIAPLGGQRIRRRRRRQRRVKRGVEAGHGRQLWQLRRDRVHCGQRLRLVQRRQVDQLPQGDLDTSVDLHGRAEALAAVHDAMTDRVCLTERGVERFSQNA